MGLETKLLLTIRDASHLLSITEADVLNEIKKGRLCSVELAGKELVRRNDLNDFLLSLRNRKGGKPMATKLDWTTLELILKNDANFTHIWPHEGDEDPADNESHFVNVKSGTARFEGSSYSIVIGFTNWESAGADRRRAVVFVDGRPVVQFTGADDFLHSRTMASVIKVEKHQVKDPSALPAGYEDLRVEPYRGHVTGLRASKGLAVVCADDDFRTMVAHALLRLENE